MHLDLSELFVCPRCRPAQGLVVLVDEIEDRRVARGRLGCPECDARFPLREGTLRLDAAGRGTDADEAPDSGGDDGAAEDRERDGGRPDAGGPGREEGGPAPALLRGGDPAEAAARLGALLGLPEAAGPFLLGPGLGAVAVPLAAVAEGEEVLSLAPSGGPSPSGGEGPAPDAGDGPVGGADAGRRVTRIVGAAAGALPLFSGRLGGVVLLGGPGAALEDAARVLREGGRLVVLAPGAGVAGAVEDLAVEVAARDPRAVVAVRRR